VNDLHSELDAALRTITCREAPVEAAMRRGRQIRTRRRIAAVAGVAAVAVFAAVGYPALTRPAAGPAPTPVQHQPVIVTDIPPGLGSPDNGLIALGTIGSARWQVSVKDSGSLGQCIDSRVGTDHLTGGCYQSGMLDYPSDGSPLILQGSNGGSYTVSLGVVAANVTYILLTLTDGQQLKLIPVTSHGHRYVAFVIPTQLRAVRATAYLGNGQELISVAFTHAGFGVPAFVRWTPPGQPEPRTTTALIGSGTVDGHRWSATAYIGPWGTCVEAGASGSCEGSTRMAGTQTIANLGGAAQVVVGSAAAGVAEVQVTLTDGTSSVVPVTAGGDERLWAFALGKGQHLKRWTAYDATGQQVSTGTR
jgi:hypothetical protein